MAKAIHTKPFTWLTESYLPCWRCDKCGAYLSPEQTDDRCPRAECDGRIVDWNKRGAHGESAASSAGVSVDGGVLPQPNRADRTNAADDPESGSSGDQMTDTLMGNRLRNVFFTPHILEHLVKMGTRETRVIESVPGDAQLRGAGYDPVRGAFYLTVEHASFKELAGGELIPEMRPMFEYVRPAVHIGPANDYQARRNVIEDLIESCKRNGVWLAHEDGHGAFRFMSESTEDWLRQALEE